MTNRATTRGPVYINNRGRPVYVLLSYEEYERLTSEGDASDEQREAGDS